MNISTPADNYHPLDIRLFGTFDVLVNGQPLPRLRSRKGQELLALLVLRQGRSVVRSRLAGMLWTESSESQALANLRLNLTNLRKALGAQAGRLSSPTPRTLCFDLTGATVDISDFDNGIASGDPVRMEHSVSLYLGPLMEDCGEEWVLPERAAREYSYLQALEKLTECARDQKDLITETKFLHLILAADPYCESALCDLMIACAAKRDYLTTTIIYHEFCLRLRQELNCQPDAATTALYHRLLDAHESVATASKSLKSHMSHASFLKQSHL